MLVLDHIGKTYPNGVHALGGVSLEVELGEIVAVIGGSGCGKSTLLRAIAGLDPASEGTAILDGERIGAPHVKIGIIFQEPRLLPWLKAQIMSASASITGRNPSAPNALPWRCGASALPIRPRYGRVNCRAARRSASPSRGHWCRGRKCSYSTSRFRRSMLSPAPICRIICSIFGPTPSRPSLW